MNTSIPWMNGEELTKAYEKISYPVQGKYNKKILPKKVPPQLNKRCESDDIFLLRRQRSYFCHIAKEDWRNGFQGLFSTESITVGTQSKDSW